MFHKKRQEEDARLKSVLDDSWPIEADEDKASFLRRMKLVIPPGHPGLLFLNDRTKQNGSNGYDFVGGAKWRWKNVLASVGTWGLILAFLLAAIYIARETFFVPSATTGGQGDEEIRAIIGEEEGSLGNQESVNRYVYIFGETEITESNRLTLSEINEKINQSRPAGIEVKITSMDQVEEYFEENENELVHYIVFKLEGIEYPTSAKHRDKK